VVIETLLMGLDEYHRMVMEDEGEGRRWWRKQGYFHLFMSKIVESHCHVT